MRYRSERTQDTYQIGYNLAQELKGGEVILLYGDLGAGKTVFAKGIAAGLGIGVPVTSPTFVIMRVYEGGRLTLKHFDFYRLQDSDEAYAAGLDEHIGNLGEVAVIEWAQKCPELLPPQVITVSIVGTDTDIRKITITR